MTCDGISLGRICDVISNSEEKKASFQLSGYPVGLFDISHAFSLIAHQMHF